ncbi:MAG: alpha/beta fold hydrolase, partial [Algoriella sp.]
MLYYEVEGEGKSIVFLHGFLENHSIWNNLRDDLKDQYQIIKLDLPGHGNSKTYKEENTMEEMADEVITVLDELNIDKATFVGHSMGGYVATALADLYPERTENIVLLNSSTL